MPKKTARQSPSPKVSPQPNLGLIVKGKAPRRSVEAKPALDDRSHRTDSVPLRGDSIRSRGGHERSECLGAFRSSAASCNAC